jgi:tetratricopeptide (TPR) repeat protein
VTSDPRGPAIHESAAMLGEARTVAARSFDRCVEAKALFEKAFAHHIAGELDEAEPLYLSALVADPRLAVALLFLSDLCYRRGDLPRAADFACRALPLAPGLAETHFILGNACLGLNRWEDAAQSYKRSLVLAPGRPITLSNLGLAVHRLGSHCMKKFLPRRLGWRRGGIFGLWGMA